MPSPRPYQPRGWKFILGVISGTVLLFATLEHFAVPQIGAWIQKKTTTELVALVTIFVSLAGVSWQIVFYRLTHYPILNLGLEVRSEGPLVRTILAKIENAGAGKIVPRTTHLLVDEGQLGVHSYSFPDLMFYQEGKKHCQLGLACHSGITTYPTNLLEDNFKKGFTAFFTLKYLSKALSYVGKSESFTENVVVKFPKPGVYRVILVCSTINDRCRCRVATIVVNASEAPADKRS